MHSASSSPARRLFLAFALLASASLALPARVHAQTRYTITNLGSISSSDMAINAAGTIVASAAGSTVLYSGGSSTPVPGLTLPSTIAYGINASGAIVGLSQPSSTPTAFLVAGGVLTHLGPGVAAAINDAGTVAVYGSATGAYLRSASGVVTPLPAPSGEVLFINDLNEAGTAAGYLFFASRAVLATPAGVTQLGILPGGTRSVANAINSDGVAVGRANPAGTNFDRAVLFSSGTVTNLDPTGTGVSEAFAINSAGTVVGTMNDRATAFVYTAATGLVNLSTLVNNLAASGFTALSAATGINAAGQICGYGMVGGAQRAFRLDPVAGPAVAPTITTHPQSQAVAAGGDVTFSVAATGSPSPSYEWRFNNTPLAGATTASYALAAVTAANAGSYTVRVFNTAGTVTSNAATLSVTAAPQPVAARLVNLSILTSLAGAGDSFTMGYVVGGQGTSGTKPLVIRAAGPSLAQLGVAGPLADPQLTLFTGATQSGANDNWGGGAALLTAMNNVGAFPFASATSLDAAVAASVAAGDNSVRVAPVGNLSGQVIAEIYDATPEASFTAATPRLVNVSVLKNIGPSLTAGFVIRGTGSRSVLIRAVGPTLGAAPFNVPGVVADPQLTLFSGQTQIGANDNWGGTAALTAAFNQVGAFALPAASRDAALLATLQPGNYTVQVSGVGGTTGTAIVEVYEAP